MLEWGRFPSTEFGNADLAGNVPIRTGILAPALASTAVIVQADLRGVAFGELSEDSGGLRVVDKNDLQAERLQHPLKRFSRNHTFERRRLKDLAKIAVRQAALIVQGHARDVQLFRPRSKRCMQLRIVNGFSEEDLGRHPIVSARCCRCSGSRCDPVEADLGARRLTRQLLDVPAIACHPFDRAGMMQLNLRGAAGVVQIPDGHVFGRVLQSCDTDEAWQLAARFTARDIEQNCFPQRWIR
jgi:hypothetical protein